MERAVNKAVGKALRAMRQSRGLTQTEIADVVGVKQATVSNWENGRFTPDYADIRDYTHAVGETPSSLFATVEAEVQASLPDPVRERALALQQRINSRHFGGIRRKNAN